ncbi:MAG: peroxiredoxin [Flavobacteriales bacterium]|nr:peroxiredoxin [Flavobacteriales bacterium]
MSLVGKKAPHFKEAAVEQGGKITPDFSLEPFLGKKDVILFFYPMDFTFVCPTELLAFQEKLKDFQDRGVEVVAVSTDTEQSHWAWLNTPVEEGGIKGVTYPIVSDKNKTISKNYGVLAGDYFYDDNDQLHADTPAMVAYRGLFLIDKDGVVRHELINDLPLGRSVDEALRVVDALQHFRQYGDVCPAGWKKGQEALKPTHSGVADYLAQKKMQKKSDSTSGDDKK